jgi:hypothetical protein
MTENFLSAVLTFSVLAAGTVAIGSEMVAPSRPAATTAAVATLPPVQVVGKRSAAAAPAAVATLPLVTIIGKSAAVATVATLPQVTVTGKRAAVAAATPTKATLTDATLTHCDESDDHDVVAGDAPAAAHGGDAEIAAAAAADANAPRLQ